MKIWKIVPWKYRGTWGIAVPQNTR